MDISYHTIGKKTTISMIARLLFCSLIFLTTPLNLAAQFQGLNPYVYSSPVSIQVPTPRHYTPVNGTFHAPRKLLWYVNPMLENQYPRAISLLSQALTEMLSYTTSYGITFIQTPNSKKAQLVINGPESLPDPNQAQLPTIEQQYYSLEIQKQKITIYLGGSAAAFHLYSNIQQWIYYYTDIAPYLFPDQTTYPLNCASIKDYPDSRYRGMHLDIVRHFFRQEHISQYLEMMALYKFNVLHLHLTDDQGWRIEIPSLPKLQTTAAYRNGSQVGPYKNQEFDTLKYGGFLTRNNIRFLVKKASELGIVIIPEIEMPGHAMAALAAYPHLSCNGGALPKDQSPANNSTQKSNQTNTNESNSPAQAESVLPFEVAKGWGVFDDVFCAGNEETFKFLETVLTDVMGLFPNSPYIHIGGDECPKTRWKSCPKCQKRMKVEGLHDEHELQSYFIRRMEKFVNAKGKKIIGWDEILEGGLAPDATVMSWRGELGGLAAAQQKHQAIMTPGKPLYFDHYQSKDSTEPHAIGGFNPLDVVYNYSPYSSSHKIVQFDDLHDTISPYILGAQGNVWTEYMPTWEHVQYMITPRMQALGEGLWLPENRKNFDNFLQRIKLHTTLWNYNGIENWGTHYLQSPTMEEH
jgi:hexosaminidase